MRCYTKKKADDAWDKFFEQSIKNGRCDMEQAQRRMEDCLRVDQALIDLGYNDYLR